MSNNSSDGIKKLNEYYEDGLFRLVMNDVAEKEGKLPFEENEQLKNNAENLPSQKEIDRFNKLLEKHLEKVKKTNKSSRMPKMLRRALAAVAAIIIVFSTMMMTVQAFRIQVLNFFISIEQKYTSFGLNSNDNGQNGGKLVVNWTNAYMPTYIPDGYKISNISYSDSIKRIMLNNQDKNSTIIYSDFDSSTSIAIDTEGASLIKSITINGQEGTLSIKGSVTTIVWKIDNHIFTVQGQISADEATKMAEGVKFFK